MIVIMKGLREKLFKISNLKFVVAFLVPAILILCLNQNLDNDSWYVLSEGREIAKNGVYYTDQLSMHEGLNITVQNYGFATIFYYVHQTFGAAGIYLGMLILNFVVCFWLYKICHLISNKNTNLSLIIMVVTDCLLVFSFVVTRAQMVSFGIFLALIYILELYIKTNKAKYLLWVPLLSVLQVNLHASLWPMLPIVIGVYLIDSIRKPILRTQGYRSLPLIIALVAVVLVGLLNPYGIKMLTFILTSYGNPRFNSMVKELLPYAPLTNLFSIFIYMALCAVIFLYAFGEKKNVRVRYLLLLFGFLLLGLNTVKGLSQFVLVLFFPLALVYKDVHPERLIDFRPAKNALMLWVGAIAIASFAIVCPVVVANVADYPNEESVSAVDAIDADGALEKGHLKVYTGYNDGGYLEWRGYKPYLDPRGEVFLKKNNGKEDILYEWDDLRNGTLSTASLIEKYNFDYIFSHSNHDPFYNLNDARYELIFNDDTYTAKVFKRVAE